MNTPPWLLIAAFWLVTHVGVAEDPFPQTRLALREGRWIKERNQTFPFRFEGPPDDPVFHAALRAQTTPRAAAAKPAPQSTSGSGLAPSAGERPTAVSTNPLVPAWFPQAPPLPPPRGEVVRVATVEELLAAGNPPGNRHA